MQKKLNYAITSQSVIEESTFYSLNVEQSYIISNPHSRRLLCGPEIIGYQIPELLLQPVTHALALLYAQGRVKNVNIVNILRGGLNFPIEAACAESGIKIDGISFLTSERIFLREQVMRIESKYRKITAVDYATIIIGDIIASGETLHNAVRYVEEQYLLAEKHLKNIIIFTIGTGNALKLIGDLSGQLKEKWPEFEGITAIFLEGIFTTYADAGITGLNLPNIDFLINGSLAAPEYRRSFMENEHTVFEKCVIYDGGARRFEKTDHISCILGYWSGLMARAHDIRMKDFLEEKYGYGHKLPFEEWRQINHYEILDVNEMRHLYGMEQSFLKKMLDASLPKIAEDRFLSLKAYYSDYM